MTTTNKYLANVAEEIKQGRSPPPVSVRKLLEWFGAQRRGPVIVDNIRAELAKAGLITEPDFVTQYVDFEISFKAAPAVDDTKKGGKKHDGQVSDASPEAHGEGEDPSYSVGRLRAARNVPTFVRPDSTLVEAVTLMMASGFSQLPVMTGEQTVKGVVSWSSIAAKTLLAGQREKVSEVMEPHHEIRIAASVFAAIPTIVEHGYVLVRAENNKISGIVTASDMSEQFRVASEPFLLLGEIENHIRRIIGKKFTQQELEGARDSESSKSVKTVADLAFGEYLRLLENPDRWPKLGLALDRAVFCKKLNEVREVRNGVMHFASDDMPPEDLQLLRDFSVFLARLQSLV